MLDREATRGTAKRWIRRISLEAGLLGLLVVATPLSALAVTLVTPDALTAGSNLIVFCNVTNPSDKKTVEVDVELVDDDGVSVASTTMTVPPRATEVLADPRPSTFRGSSCRFSFGGSRRKVIGYLSVYDGDLVIGHTTQTLDAR